MVTLADKQHGVVARRQLLDLGLGSEAIQRRIASGRLHGIHRGVYAVGRTKVSRRGWWLAAVLAYGDEALLSHQSAAALWGLMRARTLPVHVTSSSGRRGRDGITLHEGRLESLDRAMVDAVPVTTVARTLLDLAEVVDENRLGKIFEEADRLGFVELRVLEGLCDRSAGRRGLPPIRRLIANARAPVIARSSLEERFAAFCHEQGLPPPTLNALVLGFEVDALWPSQQLIVELDGFAYHRHRTAFERDRARDAALQAAGYRVIRLTHRRLEREADTVAAELRHVLSSGRDRR